MDLIRQVFGDPALMDAEELEYAYGLIHTATVLSGGAKETLLKLRNKGPIWDGDVPSKSGRDELLDCDAAAKVVVRGEQGYQACTYKGWDLAKVVDAIGRSSEVKSS